MCNEREGQITYTASWEGVERRGILGDDGAGEEDGSSEEGLHVDGRGCLKGKSLDERVQE